MSTNQYSIFQIRAAVLDEGHVLGTLQIGHTIQFCSAGLFRIGCTMDITESILSSPALQGWNGLC